MLLLPVSGTDTNWFRNLEKNSELTISVGKLTFVRRARPTKDKNFAKEVADKFRAKYGADQVKKYYSKFDAAVELKI